MERLQPQNTNEESALGPARCWVGQASTPVSRKERRSRTCLGGLLMEAQFLEERKRTAAEVEVSKSAVLSGPG